LVLKLSDWPIRSFGSSVGTADWLVSGPAVKNIFGAYSDILSVFHSWEANEKISIHLIPDLNAG